MIKISKSKRKNNFDNKDNFHAFTYLSILCHVYTYTIKIPFYNKNKNYLDSNSGSKNFNALKIFTRKLSTILGRNSYIHSVLNEKYVASREKAIKFKLLIFYPPSTDSRLPFLICFLLARVIWKNRLVWKKLFMVKIYASLLF